MNKKLLALLIANLFLAAPAFAQSDFQLGGSVSVGGIRVDDADAADASKLNEYRDLSNGLLTGFDLTGRGTRHWLNAFGENLGRDDMYVTVRGGMYDVFRYRAYSDSLKHNWLFNGRTPYDNAGSGNQTAVFPRLDPNLWNALDIGYKRRNTGAVFEFQALTPWFFRADASQVTTTGTKPGSSSQGLSPGNGFVELAFPVEYKTRNATLEAGYNSKTIHAALSWMTSKFDNDNESFRWTNGFWGNGTDTSYLGPDNKYSRLAGNATFRRLPMGSTLAVRFTKDELESDATLAATTLHTGGVMAATGPNVGTFNGKIENETFTVALASAPARNVDTRLYYNYYKRDDKSTHIEYNSALGVFDNEPFSYKKKNYGIDAFFRINRGSRIGAGYDYLDTKRDGRIDYDNTKDKRFFVEYKNSMLDDLAARVKYQRLARDSNFRHGDEGTGSTDVNYLSRFATAFDLSNVDQDQLKLTLDFTPMPFLDLSFEGVIKDNKYKNNVLGRQKDDRREVYVSASYGEPSGPRITVFGDAEEIKYESQHRIVTFGSTAPGSYDPLFPPTAAAYNWTGKVKDRNWAAGIAVAWPVMPKLALSASAIYYKTDGLVDLALQEGVPSSVVRPAPISNFDDTKRTSLNVKGVYALDKAWTITAGYAYEKYDYSDSQYAGYRYTIPGPNNANSYLNGLYANPQYKANIIYGLATYRF
ncbi:MAG: MtrB/PioB family outer membrane beta-barrel protein [Usitatibacter sp.]